MKDLVSIIIPTYNRAKTIKKSIQSCLDQTYENIEVIVVDDGSTDNTDTIVKLIKDKRVKYYKYKNNKGACYARNYGIKKSNGKYITFNDSDDIIHNNKVENHLKNLLKNKSDMDFCKMNIVFDKDNTLIVQTSNQINGFNKNGHKSEIVKGNYISTSCIFVKKKAIDGIRFDEQLPRLQDYDLVLRLIPIVKLSFSNSVYVDSIRQGDSISHDASKLEKACIIMLSKQYDYDSNNRLGLIETLLNMVVNNKNEILLYDNNEYKKILKYKDNQICELEKTNNELNIQLNNIINSRRYKLINLFFNKKR